MPGDITAKMLLLLIFLASLWHIPQIQTGPSRVLRSSSQDMIKGLVSTDTLKKTGKVGKGPEIVRINSWVIENNLSPFFLPKGGVGKAGCEGRGKIIFLGKLLEGGGIIKQRGQIMSWGKKLGLREVGKDKAWEINRTHQGGL